MDSETRARARARAILRTAAADCGCRIPSPFDEVAEHAIRLALDRVDERERALVAGLEPFARAADDYSDPDFPSDDDVPQKLSGFTIGDLRRAHALIQETSNAE